MGDQKIIINLSNEYKIKVEKVEEFEKSIFVDVYKAARENVLEIIKHSSGDKNIYDSYNNIIAFTGERGKGKSSAMISFLESLKAVGKRVENDDFLDPFYSRDNSPKNHFIDLDVIDPSLFRGNESLFEIILAKMFSKFKKIIENDNRNESTIIIDEDRRRLVKLFQNVFENLKYTSGNNKEELYKQEALDALIKLSTSSNLRESFKDLIKCYLSVMSPNTRQESILIITIDDFDLKIEGVYEMLEDVRQFLITENVIVLIACKMEQMKEAVQASIYSHYISKIGNNQSVLETIFEHDEIMGKANKYLEKLIPLSKQNKIEDINLILDSKDQIQIQIGGKTILHVDTVEKIESSINQLIYNEFGALVPVLKLRKNNIYPKTIREFIEFFQFVEVSDNESDISYNITVILKYLISKIANKIVKNRIEDLLNSKSNELKLNFILFIKNSFTSDILEKDVDFEKLNLLLSAENDSNISIADISVLIRLLESPTKYLKDITDSDSDYIILIIQLLLREKSVTFEIPEIYNGVYRIARKDRDWRYFKKSFSKDEKGFKNRLLVHYFGEYEKNKHYREHEENPFMKKFNTNINYGVFSPLSFYGNFHKLDYFEVNNIIPIDEYFKLLKENYSEYLKSDFYLLLDNPVFLNELLKTLKEINFEYRNSSLPDKESEIMNSLIYQSFDRAMEKTIKKFSLIIIKRFNFRNLIKIVYKDNLDEINELNFIEFDKVKEFNDFIESKFQSYRKDKTITPKKLSILKNEIEKYCLQYDSESKNLFYNLQDAIDEFSAKNRLSTEEYRIDVELNERATRVFKNNLKNIFKNGQSQE